MNCQPLNHRVETANHMCHELQGHKHGPLHVHAEILPGVTLPGRSPVFITYQQRKLSKMSLASPVNWG